MAADIISSTTQQFLDIHDIVNNFIVMKDGTVSVVITVDAMNFGLLAEEEQDAVMYAYAGLLNSLNYPIQIVINSQTKDVTSYLQLLKDQENSASNETIRRRIKQYREFVTNLIHDRNVLDKKFYVVIPANSIELGFAGAKSVLPGSAKFDINSIERSILLEKAQNILDPRRDHLIAQFARIGLFSRQLTTQEIIQLFYIRYNPEAAEGQQIAESSSYASPLVEASIQGSVMNTDTIVPPTVAGTTPAAPTQPPAVDPNVPTMPNPAPDVMDTQDTPVGPAAAPSPTDTTAGTADTLDSMSNVLEQSTSSMDTPAPSSPPASGMGAVPPTTPPLTPSAPPLQTEAAPEVDAMSAAPAVSTSPAAPMVNDNELDVQADLDATVKELGVSPTTPATDATAAAPAQPAPSAATPGTDTPVASTSQPGELPPLPEI